MTKEKGKKNEKNFQIKQYKVLREKKERKIYTKKKAKRKILFEKLLFFVCIINRICFISLPET